MSKEVPQCYKCGSYCAETCFCQRGPWNRSLKPRIFVPPPQEVDERNMVKSPAMCSTCGASYIQDCTCKKPAPYDFVRDTNWSDAFQGKKRDRVEVDTYHVNQGIIDAQCLRLSRLISSKFEPLLHDPEHIKTTCRLYGTLSDNLNHPRVKEMIDEFISEVDKVEKMGWKEKK